MDILYSPQQCINIVAFSRTAMVCIDSYLGTCPLYPTPLPRAYQSLMTRSKSPDCLHRENVIPLHSLPLRSWSGCNDSCNLLRRWDDVYGADDKQWAIRPDIACNNLINAVLRHAMPRSGHTAKRWLRVKRNFQGRVWRVMHLWDVQCNAMFLANPWKNVLWRAKEQM